MSLTESRMLPLGTRAPDFHLPEPEGERYRLADFGEYRALVVCFICNHCPYVVHIRDKLCDLAHAYWNEGVGFVAISANDPVNYPEDAPARMAELRRALNMPFPYLFDESQQTAKAYGAVCTPEFFLFDANRALFYRGRFDDSSPGNHRPVTGADLRAAIEALLDGRNIPEDSQNPAMGCSIKWRDGHEPQGM